ncbi:MAG: hypothetical protein FJ161_00795 [Gammaproteobacteria bacterium]|nr:hypothetical protein [Gammaproteobacteria bacterium]
MKFNSETLQKSFEQSKMVLENIHNIKDLISEDIKKLEAYIKSLNLNETIDYIFSTSYIYIGPNGIPSSEKLIVWDHNKKRLLYVENQYEASSWDVYCIEAYIDGDIGDEDNNKTTIIEKPLIETSFVTRKEVYESGELAKFLLFVKQRYEIVDLTLVTPMQ